MPRGNVIVALTVAVGAAVATSGCENAGAGRVLSINATANVDGFAYLDRDGDRRPSSADTGFAGVRIRLIAAGSQDTAARVTADAEGNFAFRGVPVGQYRIVVLDDVALFGDSVSVVKIDSTSLTLTPNDTTGVEVSVAVSYPFATVAELRGSTTGRRVFVEAVALNARDTFGDSTVHISDTTGFIRIAGLRTNVLAGDSVRFLGRRETRDETPSFGDVRVNPIGFGSAPPIELITTAEAVTADDGRLDAALVRIVGGEITDTITVGGDYLVTVDDGSGALIVVFDLEAGLIQTPYVPTASVRVVGLLVPTGAGEWRLKPRVNADVILQ